MHCRQHVCITTACGKPGAVTADPTCCSGSRATAGNGTGGRRLLSSTTCPCAAPGRHACQPDNAAHFAQICANRRPSIAPRAQITEGTSATLAPRYRPGLPAYRLSRSAADRCNAGTRRSPTLRSVSRQHHVRRSSRGDGDGGRRSPACCARRCFTPRSIPSTGRAVCRALTLKSLRITEFFFRACSLGSAAKPRTELSAAMFRSSAAPLLDRHVELRPGSALPLERQSRRTAACVRALQRAIKNSSRARYVKSSRKFTAFRTCEVSANSVNGFT